MLSGDPRAMGITAIVGTVVAYFLILVSLPEIIGGIGLLKRCPWARILVLVISFVDLINIPFGTIIGVYSIWVLLKDETVKMFAPAQAKQVDTPSTIS
jgi:hypothetical protein